MWLRTMAEPFGEGARSVKELLDEEGVGGEGEGNVVGVGVGGSKPKSKSSQWLVIVEVRCTCLALFAVLGSCGVAKGEPGGDVGGVAVRSKKRLLVTG